MIRCSEIVVANRLEVITNINAAVKSQFIWKVSDVSPCSKIYFLEFDNGTEKLWTGRFAICDKGVSPEEKLETEADEHIGHYRGNSPDHWRHRMGRWHVARRRYDHRDTVSLCDRRMLQD
jgi:hypothetical protein